MQTQKRRWYQAGGRDWGRAWGSQGPPKMAATIRSWKGQEGPSLETWEGARPCRHLYFFQLLAPRKVRECISVVLRHPAGGHCYWSNRKLLQILWTQLGLGRFQVLNSHVGLLPAQCLSLEGSFKAIFQTLLEEWEPWKHVFIQTWGLNPLPGHLLFPKQNMLPSSLRKRITRRRQNHLTIHTGFCKIWKQFLHRPKGNCTPRNSHSLLPPMPHAGQPLNCLLSLDLPILDIS